MFTKNIIAGLRVFLLLIFFSPMATLAQVALDLTDLQEVVEEWNYANNHQSVETFNRLYGDRVVFYTETLSRAQCIREKQRLFENTPEFRQEIISAIACVPYSSGVTKCEFVKEVSTGRSNRRYPGYLVITYEDQGYLVVGESDYETDRKLNYSPDLGYPLDIPSVAQHSMDSVLDTEVTLTDSALRLDSLLPSQLATRIIPKSSIASFSGNYIITIPKWILWVSIFLIVSSFLLLLIRRPRSSSSKQKPLKARDSKRGGDDQKFYDYRDFILGFFDPLHFKIQTGTGEAGGVPHLLAEFNHKDTFARVAIQLTYTELNEGEINIVSASQWEQMKSFSKTSAFPIYVVVGTGGVKGVPDRVFLVPFSALTAPVISFGHLERYRKHGMFFFNSKTRQLQ